MILQRQQLADIFSTMKRFYKVFRAVLISVVAVAIFLPAALYLVLSTDWAQEKMRQVAVEELSKTLGTEVNIGKVKLVPFNRLDLSDVTIDDDYGKTALTAPIAEVRFEFWNFVTTGRLAFDYAVLRGLDARLYKLTPDSPLNIAGIIEKLKSKDKNKPPTRFDLALHTVRIENASFSYDVVSQSPKDGKFDPNHVSLSALNLTATAPKLSNDEISAKIRHLSFVDRSGLDVRNLRFDATYTPRALSVNDIALSLPNSQFNLGSYNFEYDDPSQLAQLFKSTPLQVNLAPDSYFTLSDFGWALPQLAGVSRRFGIEADALVSERQIDINNFKINEVTDGGFYLAVDGQLTGPFKPESLTVDGLNVNVQAYESSVTDLLRRLNRSVPQNVARLCGKLGRVDLTAAVSGSLNDLAASVSVSTKSGSVDADAVLSTADSFKTINADIDAEIVNVNLGALTGDERLGLFNSNLSAQIQTRKGRNPVVDMALDNTSLQYKGHVYRDIEAEFALNQAGDFDGYANVAVDDATLTAEVSGHTDRARPSIAGKVEINGFNPNELGLIKQYPGYTLSADADFDLAGKKGHWIDGYVNLSNIRYESHDDRPSLNIGQFNVTADNTVRPNIVTVTSDFLNGTFQGNLSLLNIVDQAKAILSPMMSALIPMQSDRFAGMNLRDNDFHFNLTLDNVDNLTQFLRLPIQVIHPIEIDGSLSHNKNEIIFGIDAPYLMKGDMIIEGTSIQGQFGGESDTGRLYLSTQFPTKKGEMVVVGGITARDNVFSTELDWRIEREKPIEGKFAFDTEVHRDVDTGEPVVKARFMPCNIRFGNDTWTMWSSMVTYSKGYLDVDRFAMTTPTQSIAIDGTNSADNPSSEILMTLDNVVLDAIFETLDINKALLSGKATGTFHVRDIFGSQPILECPRLHVDNIGYNHCVLGDGEVKANWNNEHKSFFLDAVVTGPDNNKSYISGDIFPATESLDISFDADSVQVGFMKPFIEAFAGDISGHASGHFRLFGTFKYIDMEGDVLAHDLGIKINFTNTWYYAADSIHLRPGLIDIPKTTIRDSEGHTAQLQGVVRHAYFKDPEFDFRVTDAVNFLSYDVTPKLSPDWYGHVYGNGSAFITGSPGIVNIDIDMTSAEGSTFTFVLSDLEEAMQYNFLTFRDKNREVITDSIIQVDILPPAVRASRDAARAKALAQNPPTAYNMDIQMDITPAAKIILVMDPVGGDEIKSWGSGNLRMTYASKSNDLRMYGTYIIDRGSYNFTLQDIIVKDFTIEQGSSIAFTGDPYSAALDIKAYYALNANLTDLDESFMNDAELNRTNVPVRAMLLINGDMRQPDIDFDINFPTLTSDIYRKVRSIISTDEMMKRQMIYLLALNRFYTPEYMTATKGSELFSVASSTISSRLSSMLGKLSENWRIAPNLRSDKGDFSDVEFDLALSSNLLNNRLRFNGNFGYRDKSLNTNQFIGDFDIEYLINRSGSWRLKAYNRFNDQTYFLRTAKTTQGVGIKFQRDFDDLFGFLRRRKQDEPTDSVPQPAPADTIVPAVTDTLKITSKD